MSGMPELSEQEFKTLLSLAAYGTHYLSASEHPMAMRLQDKNLVKVWDATAVGGAPPMWTITEHGDWVVRETRLVDFPGFDTIKAITG